MKNIILLLIAISFSQLAFAKGKSQDSDEFRIGGVIGVPTGVTAKWDKSNSKAIDATLAFNFDGTHGLEIHGDYLTENWKPVSINQSKPIHLFYGLGGRMMAINSGSDKGKIRIGPRFPLGFTYEMQTPGMQLFAELAAVLDIIPTSHLAVDGGIGLRWRF